MELEIQRQFQIIFNMNINWFHHFMIHTNRDNTDVLFELKQASIINEDQYFNLLYPISTAYASLQVIRYSRLGQYLRSSATYLQFFRYLRVKSYNNEHIQFYLEIINQECSNNSTLFLYVYNF